MSDPHDLSDASLDALFEASKLDTTIFAGSQIRVLIGEIRRLRAAATTPDAQPDQRGAVVVHCLGCRGGIDHPCSDPQCGDSTWDHECDARYERCPGLPPPSEAPGNMEARASVIEEVARLVDGWHISRGGYTELAFQIRTLAPPRAAKSAEAKPKVFLFINGGAGTDWVSSMALAEDGTCLAQHVSSSDGFAHHDIGHTSERKHEHYRAHYPQGYEVEWVDDAHPGRHAGLDAAYVKNQALAAEAKSIL